MNKKNGLNRVGIWGGPFPVAVISILAVLSLLLAGQSFMAPIEITEEIVTHSLKQDVSLDYLVFPRPSALYPEAKPLNNQQVYFTQVTEGLQVSLKADLTTEPALPVEGSAQVVLKLQAGNLWEREYILSPEREFKGQGTMTVVEESLAVPLKELLAFTKQVEEETGVYPRDGYTLNIVPVIKARAHVAGEPLENEFAPAFPFILNQRQLTPPPQLQQEKGAELKGTAVIPGSVKAAFIELPVVTARYVFAITAGMLLLAALLLGRLYLQNRPCLSEVGTINRRYRSRIINAHSGAINTGVTEIRLSSFKELLKLADESDKSILCLHELEDWQPVYRYCVLEGGTLYFYVASDEAPLKKIEPQRSLKERVMPRGGVSS